MRWMLHVRVLIAGLILVLAGGVVAGDSGWRYSEGGSGFTWVEKEAGVHLAEWSHPGKKKKLPNVFAHILRARIGDGLEMASLRPPKGGMRLEHITKHFRGAGVKVRASLNGDYYSFADREKDPLGLFIHKGIVLWYPANTSSLLYDTKGEMHMGVYTLKQTVRQGFDSFTIDGANRDPDKGEAIIFSGLYTQKIDREYRCWNLFAKLKRYEPMVGNSVELTVTKSVKSRSVRGLGEKDLVIMACGDKAEKAKSMEEGDLIQLISSIPGIEHPVREAISGGPRVLRRGKAVDEARKEGFSMALKFYIPRRHPRSAVGISKDRKTLYMMAIEGRSIRRSSGMTAVDTGNLLAAAGAWDGMLFDGGGSSVLEYAGEFLNKPHRGRDYTARRLANLLAVVRTGAAKR